MHGGDIYRNDIELDFSVNVNPLGMPESVGTAAHLTEEDMLRYPDIRSESLCRRLGKIHGVSASQIVCGNGASELIQGICFMSKAQKAILNAPSFSGYERSLNTAGTRIYYNYLSGNEDFKLTGTFCDKIKTIRPKLVFVTNPNNPDGNLIDEDTRKDILKACRDAEALLIADECFIEMTKENENGSFLKDVSDEDNLIVIRAFTKSYGMPGLRLGYAICSDEFIAERLGNFLPEWNISGPAQKIGCAVAGDEQFLAKSRDYIETERNYLTRSLTSLGMKVYASDANFLLFEDGEDRNLYELLLKKKILIRDCSDYMGLKSGHYRVAVKKHEDNERLVQAMKDICSR